jgi:hypothetical protein
LAQYIDGFNIFNDPSLANEPLLKGWQLWLVVGAGAAVLLLVLLVVGLCWLRAKRRGVLPAWLGGGRQPLSRKRKYQMDFDKGVAGGSASTSPSSGRIGAMVRRLVGKSEGGKRRVIQHDCITLQVQLSCRQSHRGWTPNTNSIDAGPCMLP